jgi:hypothetical protein
VLHGGGRIRARVDKAGIADDAVGHDREGRERQAIVDLEVADLARRRADQALGRCEYVVDMNLARSGRAHDRPIGWTGR